MPPCLLIILYFLCFLSVCFLSIYFPWFANPSRFSFSSSWCFIFIRLPCSDPFLCSRQPICPALNFLCMFLDFVLEPACPIKFTFYFHSLVASGSFPPHSPIPYHYKDKLSSVGITSKKTKKHGKMHACK